MLSERQARFVAEYLLDGNGAAAAVRAGYAPASAKVSASRLLTNANVQAALDARRDEVARDWVLNRDLVIKGMLGAISMAQAQQNPQAIIQGWREIARFCGFYPPATRQRGAMPAETGSDRPLSQQPSAVLLAMLGND